MVVLRCTVKLLKRLKMEKNPLKDPGPSTTALGDWYANVVYVERQPLVLAVSEKSLLPLLIHARKLDQLPGRLMRTLVERLQRMGLPETVMRQEITRMDPFSYGKTASRSVLGTMNEFTFMLKCTSSNYPDLNLVDMMDWLSNTLCSPLGLQYPAEKAEELLRESSIHVVKRQ